MGAIADIFREFGPEYMKHFKSTMPKAHVDAIRLISECHTSALGGTVFTCIDCHEIHCVNKGCGSRNCPNCQQHKGEEWLQKRLDERLPGHHFMITFTVPEELRSFIRTEQKSAYDAMFEASSQALRELVTNPKFIGADLPGFFGVLHTWGRQLQYHPHIHYIVPGGGIDKQSQTWKKSREDFFVSIHALGQVFRGKLHDAFKKRNLLQYINPVIWSKSFVVNSQAVGNSPEGAIKYLAPYVFRVGISDSRIVSVTNRKVTFTYKKVGSNRQRRTTLDVFEFMRRFLQHVLPKGFMKVRYYGFMSSASRLSMQEVSTMIELANAFEITLTPTVAEQPARPDLSYCPKCGGKLAVTRFISPRQPLPG